MSYDHAYTLHRTVRADRWSVTKQDLKDFAHACHCAVLDGEILPSSMDGFDLDSTRGPNMYTVTEQFIKVKTAAAGGMSWALMVHPDGLECDLFVSHAWREGVFELISNLLNGWLWGLRHAWCCALANPQNLDISALICKPSESPFAVALTFASHMVVVSNSETGIYSRLWCCYEAFLGYELGKTITVGRPPIVKDVLRSLVALTLVFVLTCVLAAFTSKLFIAEEQQDGFAICLVVLEFVCFACTFCEDTLIWRICNMFGMSLAGIILGFSVNSNPPYPISRMKIRAWNCPEVPVQLIAIGGHVVVVAVWIVSEADRIRFGSLDAVAKELQRGYTGSVRHARCTNDDDEKNLLAAIDGHVEDVNQAINLLISSGMYSGSLGAAADRGVHVKGVSRFRVSPLVFWFGRVAVHEPARVGFDSTWDSDTCLQLTLMVWILTWLLVYANMRIDRKAFMVAASNKAALLWAVDYIVTVGLGASTAEISGWFASYDMLSDILWNIMFPLLISVACLGIDGLTSSGCFGRWLARFIAANGGCGESYYNLGQHASTPNDSGSSSSDS